uniref:UBA_e1_C domain-containing protein n=1 Tax=Rhabditophanes sp. KR3021 TaxID=114890 RepID=A0AC35TNG8_9BILA
MYKLYIFQLHQQQLSAVDTTTKGYTITGNNQNSAPSHQHEPMDTANNEKGETVDTDLYSRQIYALGESAMLHLRKANILIYGMDAVGVEIAKNLVLGGVRHVTIKDDKSVGWADLSGQYYLNEADLGNNRAEACVEKLAELNDSVSVAIHPKPLTEDEVKQFDLIVVTDMSWQAQLHINKWARANGTKFLSADARGVFSYVFADFGEDFMVEDLNGEQVREFLIEHISVDGNITTIDGAHHGLEDGDYVTFSEVKGAVQLNDIAPQKILVQKPNSFKIPPETMATLSEYVEGGRCKQVKVPTKMTFKSLQESLKEPEFAFWDYAKMDAPGEQLALWTGVYAYESGNNGNKLNGRREGNVSALRTANPSLGDVSDDKINQFADSSRGNLAPVASVVGGIAAQEAMKALTHHTTPLKQFLFIDHVEVLPGAYSAFDHAKLTESDVAPRQNRYDGQAAVFGWDYQESLSNQKWFIVGAGAIGCELVKNAAMMGVGCGAEGKITITDMDQIEISNLSRQFLFRRKDVGSKKSVCAANAVRAFNSHINIEPIADRVGADTEGLFNDNFFNSLTGVLNALDNVEARRYMDRRCVFYRLPLIESGTMGTKGNTQVVYPHMTESYSSSVDPPEKEIPICTLKNFPHEIQHTIQWARDMFVGLFTNPAESANQFLSEKSEFHKRTAQMGTGQKIELLTEIKKALKDDKPQTLKDCVEWARKMFEENFHDSILQLLHNFPPDHHSEEGIKFWSGTKRCPSNLKFDSNVGEHFDFVYAGSLLRAQQYSIPWTYTNDTFKALVDQFTYPPFNPRSGVKIAVTEAEAKNKMEEDDTEAVVAELEMELDSLSLTQLHKLVPIDFEKDDDSNHHMQFITAASNLRAANYSISPADRMKTKQIAGRIIPAIATTTAAVAGLVCIELYKMVDGGSKIPKDIPMDRFKNGFINLALPFFGFSEPIAAPVKKYGETGFTLWDSMDVKGPLTLDQLKQWFEDKTGLEVSMISSGVSLVYSFFMNAEKRKTRMVLETSKAVQDVTKVPTPPFTKYIVLEAMCSDRATDEDVEVPYIKYEI